IGKVISAAPRIRTACASRSLLVLFVHRADIGLGLTVVAMPPPGGGRSASLARGEPGGGETASPHPAASLRSAATLPRQGRVGSCHFEVIQISPNEYSAQ